MKIFINRKTIEKTDTKEIKFKYFPIIDSYHDLLMTERYINSMIPL
jgi:hypothetical protein